MNDIKYWIKIYPNNTYLNKNDNNLKIILKLFMRYLNNLLAGKSSLNYHCGPIINYEISIPVIPYNNEEFNKKLNELAKDKCQICLDFIKNYNFSNESKKILNIIRNLIQLSETKDLSDVFSLKCPQIHYDTKLYFPKIDIKYSYMKHFKLIDESNINHFIDPYLKTQYALVFDISKHFEEYKYQYNLLHFFEHILCSPWDNLDRTHQIAYNGLTVSNGVSCVWVILDNEETMELYLKKTIEWIIKMRDINNWDNIKNILTRETQRTTSETRENRMFSSSCRADPSAYNNEYNINVLCKWANEPLNVLIYTSKEIKLDINNLNEIIKNNLPKEINVQYPTFPYIPVECIVAKKTANIIKSSPKEILNKILNEEIYGNQIYGIDSVLIFPSEYYFDFNYTLHILLYLNKYLSEEEEQKFLMNNMFPYDFKNIFI